MLIPVATLLALQRASSASIPPLNEATAKIDPRQTSKNAATTLTHTRKEPGGGTRLPRFYYIYFLCFVRLYSERRISFVKRIICENLFLGATQKLHLLFRRG